MTPSYNQGRFIEETVESVINQSYPCTEFIVIDGGSSDNTLGILERYKDHFTYWTSEPDRGQSHALNKGFEKVTGDIIGWLNSDDTYFPETFDRVREAFEHHPEVDVVYGNFVYVDNDGSIVRKRKVLASIDYDLLVAHNYLGQPAVFFRRRVLEQVGLIDENLHYALDWDFFLRIAKNSKFLYIPYDLATYRLHQTAKTSMFGDDRFRNEVRIVHERYFVRKLGLRRLQWSAVFFKRVRIVLHDGLLGFVKMYFAQNGLSLKSLAAFIKSKFV